MCACGCMLGGCRGPHLGFDPDVQACRSWSVPGGGVQAVLGLELRLQQGWELLVEEPNWAQRLCLCLSRGILHTGCRAAFSTFLHWSCERRCVGLRYAGKAACAACTHKESEREECVGVLVRYVRACTTHALVRYVNTGICTWMETATTSWRTGLLCCWL